jgi:hypothetical protein
MGKEKPPRWAVVTGVRMNRLTSVGDRPYAVHLFRYFEFCFKPIDFVLETIIFFPGCVYLIVLILYDRFKGFILSGDSTYREEMLKNIKH